jgi:hypothetical protein
MGADRPLGPCPAICQPPLATQNPGISPRLRGLAAAVPPALHRAKMAAPTLPPKRAYSNHVGVQSLQPLVAHPGLLLFLFRLFKSLASTWRVFASPVLDDNQ